MRILALGALRLSERISADNVQQSTPCPSDVALLHLLNWIQGTSDYHMLGFYSRMQVHAQQEHLNFWTGRSTQCGSLD